MAFVVLPGEPVWTERKLMSDVGNAILGRIEEKAKNGELITQKDLDDIALFSPFAIDDVDEELVMIGAAVIGLKLSKTDKGMDLLGILAKQYFGTISSIVSSVQKGGSTHPISSMTAQMVTVRMMRRLGLISQQEANAIHHELVWAINKVAVPAILESITGVGTMVFGGISKALTLGAST